MVPFEQLPEARPAAVCLPTLKAALDRLSHMPFFEAAYGRTGLLWKLAVSESLA